MFFIMSYHVLLYYSFPGDYPSSYYIPKVETDQDLVTGQRKQRPKGENVFNKIHYLKIVLVIDNLNENKSRLITF